MRTVLCVHSRGTDAVSARGYGAQASVEVASWGRAVMDITVAVGSAARLDLAMIVFVAGTA